MYRKSLWLFSTLLTAMLSIAVIFAQGTCSDLVFEALEAVDANCTELGRNEACYGFDQVEVSFLGEISTDTFAAPADIAPVADIETIRTAPLNMDNGVWGVAVMNLQANMPNTLPGQNVTFVLLGDVEVENAVEPENTFSSDVLIEVAVDARAGANIRSGPGTNFNVIGGAADNQTLESDGLSEDGDWLRVIYRERPAWISRSVISENDAIADLPTLSADLYTPMQAIYLRTGIGEPECNEAPDDVLLVQGPENIEISLNVNGADVSLGSSGAFRVVEIDGELFLEVIVFDGTFVVGGVPVRAGQSSLMCLGDENNRGLDGESNDRSVECVQPPQQIDATQFGEEWCVIEGVPSRLLHYGIDVLCPGETPPQPDTPSNTNGGDGNGDGGIVSCDGFYIPAQPIPATDFTLSWPAVSGADNYIVAVFDSGGNETSSYSTGGTSIGLNGGVGFASSGAIHVRAYQGSDYLCVASINYNRAPDPNEPIGGYANFDAKLVSCSYPDGISFTVSWSDADGGVIVSVGSYSWSSPNSSGSMTREYVPTSSSNITVSSANDGTVILTCDAPPPL